MNDVSDEQLVAEVIERARIAHGTVEHYDQQRVDDLVTAIAWVATRPHNAENLARLAAEQSGLGNTADKTATRTPLDTDAGAREVAKAYKSGRSLSDEVWSFEVRSSNPAAEVSSRNCACDHQRRIQRRSTELDAPFADTRS